MSMESLGYTLLMGLIAGFLAGMLVKGGGYGLIGDIVVGIIGAFVGSFVFGLFGLAAYGVLAQLLVATVGAVIFLVILRTLKKA